VSPSTRQSKRISLFNWSNVRKSTIARSDVAEHRPPSDCSSINQPGELKMEICAHMEVVDANDQHVGTVESIEGDRIKMFEKDALDPKELFLNRSQVAEVDINKVRLSQKVSAITTRAFVSPEHAEKITKKE
jgi:hypothetical protein